MVADALVGVAVVGWIVSLTTMSQLVDNAHRGRVMSTYGTTQTLLMLGGMGVSGVLAAPLGVVQTLDIASGLFIISGIAATIALRTPRKERS